MTNCAKCGAELIGARKFCAACGAPIDPSSLKRPDPNIGSGPASSPAPAPAQQINVPSTAYGPPIAHGSPPVNPFAATASPSSRAAGSLYGPPPATTANPPSNAPSGHVGGPGPLDGTAPVPPVSPLAVSNALSQRGAFQQAAGERIAPAPASTPTGASAPVKKAPGTQLIPSIPNPQVGVPSQAKPPPQRTQVMDAASFARPNAGANASHPSSPNQPAAPPASAVGQPPSAIGQPPSVAHQPPPPTASPYAQPPPGQWGAPVASGWGGAPAMAAPHGAGYGFGYAPGARVNVTWSNGQRYPATVSQVSGTQVLVVFPDGQQHWVEMQYLTPG